MSLVIEIKPFADARINTDSLLVLYLKKPRINLLPRIRRFIDASRRTVVIRLDNAEAPPGTHWIVFHVKDSRQQIAEQILKLEVLPGDTQAVPASPPAESTLGSPADPTGITERAHP